MPSDRQLAVGGGTIVILGVPAYMGWAGQSLGAFITYALVAGLALTAADRLAVADFRRESAKALAQHAVLRTVSVALIGGLIYGLALVVF